MTTEEKAKAYDKAREKIAIRFGSNVADEIFSQFEISEDERIRKNIIIALKSQKDELGDFYKSHNTSESELVSWVEKQGEPFDKEKVLIGARKDVALSIINYLDNNSVGMCLSNMECEDIEDACINSKWTKLYNYMKKKLEKQGDKPFDYENANIQQKDFAPKVEPKFKVGDRVNKNDREDEEHCILTITSVNIDEHCYVCNQCSVIDFGEQDLWHIVEQKPAWSEEDKKYLRRAINATRNGYPETNNWLKSLKERMGG